MRHLQVALFLALTVTAVHAQPAKPGARPAPARKTKLDPAKAAATLVGGDVAAAATAAAELGGSKVPAHHEPLLDAFSTGVHPDVLVAGLTVAGVVLIEYLNGEYKMLSYNDTSYIEAGKAKMENPAPLNVHLVAHGVTIMDEMGWINSIIDSPLTTRQKAPGLCGKGQGSISTASSLE